MNDYGVTPDGFVVKPLADILADMADRARAMFGDDIDLRPTSAFRKVFEMAGGGQQELWKQAEQLYYSNFLSTASGLALDLLGEDLGVERRQLASRGRVTFTLSGGEPGRTYPLPAGTLVETTPPVGTPVKRFRTLARVALSATANTAEVDVVAVRRGPAEGDVAAGQILAINADYAARQLRLGAATVGVTNARPTVGGEEREDDATYRDRLLGRPRTLWTREAIRAAVREVDGVRDCRVFDPLGGVDTSRSTFNLFAFNRRPFGTARPSGSPFFFDVLVALQPGFEWEASGPVPGVRDLVLDAVKDVRPVSIFPNIRPASTVEVGLRARVILQPGADPSATTAAIKDGVDRLVNTLRLGAEIRSSDVLCRCKEVPGVVDVQGLHLRRCPARFGRVTFGRARAFLAEPTESDIAENIQLAPDEIAVFRFDSPLLDLRVGEV